MTNSYSLLSSLSGCARCLVFDNFKNATTRSRSSKTHRAPCNTIRGYSQQAAHGVYRVSSAPHGADYAPRLARAGFF